MSENTRKILLEKAKKGSNTGILRFHTLGVLLQNDRPLCISDIKKMLEKQDIMICAKTIARILDEIEALHPIAEMEKIILRKSEASKRPTQYYQLKFL